VTSPNILVVVIDTLRFDATSLAPGGRDNSPFLARFARDSTHFVRAYSTFDSTPPSHFSLLTGYVTGWKTAIDDRRPALPFQLKRLGYSTFGIAANQNLSTEAMPTLQAFDEYVCLPDLWDAMPSGDKRALFPQLDTRINPYGGRRNNFNRMMLFSSASQVIAIATRHLARVARPFFAFVNLIEPHDPYFPDPQFYDQHGSEARLRPTGFDGDLRFRRLGPPLTHVERPNDALRARLKAAEGRRWSLSDDLNDANLAVYRLRYEAEVREIDHRLDEWFSVLSKRPDFDDTLVVITSDHGESFGEGGFLTHWLSNKGDVEATRRVPLVVRFPSRLGVTAREVATPCSIADIAPTIYDILGVDWRPAAKRTNAGNYGRSLLPLVKPVSSIKYSRQVVIDDSPPLTAEERKQFDDEALERFRALGYVQ
jgi:arylsulfatase A-like enzyme